MTKKEPNLCCFLSQKKDVKIHRTVENFHSLVRTLLTDVAEREQFFKVSVSGSPLAFL